MPWRGILTGVVAAALLVVGCSKKSGPGAATERPSSAGAMSEASDAAAAEDDGAWSDPLASAQAELERHEDALLAAGVELPGDVVHVRDASGKRSVAAKADLEAGGEPATDRCQRRCDLATSICDLRGHICALADDHRDDARYARVCDRATLDCDRATEACDECEA